MSTYLILDQDSKQHVILPPSETFAKSSPTFSGMGLNQDPVKFLEDFMNAAIWNNWRTDERRKELFVRCLVGYARNWFDVEVAASQEVFDGLKFKDDSEHCIEAKFKKQFLTPEWLKHYKKIYQDRKQLPTETAWEYMFHKRALLKKFDATLETRNEEQVVDRITEGLLPHVAKFCEDQESNPFVQKDNAASTLAGLEVLLKWADQCVDQGKSSTGFTPAVQRLLPAAEATPTIEEVVEVNAMDRGRYGSRGDRNRNVTSNKARETPQATNSMNRGDADTNVTQLIWEEVKRMRSLVEKLGNDVALNMDRLELLEKGRKGDASQAPAGIYSRAGKDSNIRCFNCFADGHMLRDCTTYCNMCGTQEHYPRDCPRRMGNKNRDVRVLETVEEKGVTSQDFLNDSLKH